MIGNRLRLKDYERAYLLRLIHADIDNMHRELIGKPMLRLIDKLTDGNDLAAMNLDGTQGLVKSATKTNPQEMGGKDNEH